MKKVVVFLGIAVLASGAPAASVSAEQPTMQKTSWNRTKAPSQAAENSEPAKRKHGFDGNSLFAENSELLKQSDNSLNTGELFYKMMILVVIVVALGAAAIYVSKKFGTRLTRFTGKEIQIIERTNLGPRKMVHLVKVGKQRLLIGSTNERITMLADVTDALTESQLPSQDKEPALGEF